MSVTPAPASIRGAAGTGLIPREEWRSFLDDFTTLNKEITARLELIGIEGPESEVIFEWKPLLAVTLDDKAGSPVITIEAGDTVGETPAAFRHLLERPKAIWAREVEPGRVDAIEIECEDGPTAVLTINPHPGRDSISFEDTGRSEVVYFP